MKTPSTKQIMDSVETFVAITVGAMIGNGVGNLLPEENKGVIKAVATGAAVYGASAIGNTKDRGKRAIKNLLYGFGGTHAVSLTQEQAQKLITKKTDPSMVDRFVEGAVGLSGEYHGYQELPRLMADHSAIPVNTGSFNFSSNNEDARAAALI